MLGHFQRISFWDYLLFSEALYQLKFAFNWETYDSCWFRLRYNVRRNFAKNPFRLNQSLIKRLWTLTYQTLSVSRRFDARYQHRSHISGRNQKNKNISDKSIVLEEVAMIRKFSGVIISEWLSMCFIPRFLFDYLNFKFQHLIWDWFSYGCIINTKLHFRSVVMFVCSLIQTLFAFKQI